MIGSGITQLGCIGLALNVTTAYADRSLRLSIAHLVAEGSTVVAVHDHGVKEVKEPGAGAGSGIVLDYNSTLRIVRKSDNAEIFKQGVMPLTALASVDDGRYFAGLSNLQTLSFHIQLSAHQRGRADRDHRSDYADIEPLPIC